MFVPLTRRGAACARSWAIYWTNNFTGTIGRANRNGTGVNPNFITGAPNLIAVTLHGDYIYWTNVVRPRRRSSHELIAIRRSISALTTAGPWSHRASSMRT
jgi:hypothetical protein